jgi:hypothetical protein
MEGFLTSALILAFCVAGLHTIAQWRADQARAAGVPYWDRGRLIVVVVAGALLGAWMLVSVGAALTGQ